MKLIEPTPTRGAYRRMAWLPLHDNRVVVLLKTFVDHIRDLEAA